MVVVGVVIAILAFMAVDQLLKPLLPELHTFVAALPSIWIIWFSARQGTDVYGELPSDYLSWVKRFII